jgi:hypothetical protein
MTAGAKAGARSPASEDVTAHSSAARLSVMNRCHIRRRVRHGGTKTLAIMVACSLSGCGLFDSGVEWREGPYELLWIDLPYQLSLNYDLGREGGSIGLVDWAVFSVGSNDRYIVVKQHPQGNKAVTSYFIVDKTKALPTDPVRAVVGPLTQSEFNAQARLIKLPSFTKVVNSLK